MTRTRTPPQAKMPEKPQGLHWDVPSDAMARWAEKPLAAAGDDPQVIDIYDVIGDDWWTGGGFTDRKMTAALAAAAGRDIVVNINSPGGDMFEGIAIYNQLAAYRGSVTVNVMALAASAASVIAMAGDRINMALGSFLMVHNSWGVVVGNQHDMHGAGDLFATFDSALADIYQARVSVDRDAIVALMDAETFLAPTEAIAQGFADGKIDDPQPAAKASAADGAAIARRRVEAALAKANYSRSERQQLLGALGTQRDASSRPDALRDASVITGLESLIATLRG